MKGSEILHSLDRKENDSKKSKQKSKNGSQSTAGVWEATYTCNCRMMENVAHEHSKMWKCLSNKMGGGEKIGGNIKAFFSFFS